MKELDRDDQIIKGATADSFAIAATKADGEEVGSRSIGTKEDKHVKNKTELVDEVKTDDIKIGTEKPGQADDEKSALNEDIADTEEENTYGSSDNLPIDKGWAWIILLAAYLEVVIFGGLMKCYGIFFIAYQERFKSSASETSLILTVQNITMSFTGIFIMTIGMKYMTARTSIIIGAVLHSLFYIVTAFAENIGVLYFTVGFMPGLAGAMIFLPVVSTINTYFNKYRGLANSITMSGSSFGGLVFGPLYTALFQEYGYSGTILILSAILSHVVISGLLMRPIEFYTRNNKVNKSGIEADNDEVKELLLKNTDHTSEGVHKMNDLEKSGACADRSSSTESAYVSEDESEVKVIKHLNEDGLSAIKEYRNAFDDIQIQEINKPRVSAVRDLNRSVSYDPEKLIGGHFPSPSLIRAKLGQNVSHASRESVDVQVRKRTFSEISDSGSKLVHGVVESISRSRVALYASADVVCGSIANVYVTDSNLTEHGDVLIQQDSRFEDNSEKSHIKHSSIGRTITDFLKTAFDVSLLRSYVFIHFLCFAFLILPGSVLPTVFFATYANEIGISSSEIGIMFSIIGSLDMVSRISLGFIADRKWMRPTSILCLTAITVGTISHLIRFFTTYETLMVFVIIVGMTSGAYMSLYAVIMLENIGVDKFKGALGWATMCHGVTMASFFPITGALRDGTGTYLASFHLIGVTLYLAALLSFLLPFTHKRHEVTKDT